MSEQIIQKRKPLRKDEEIKKVMKSTIDYYQAWAHGYEKFYDEFLIYSAEEKYREGYKKVEEILHETVKPNQLVIDVGCGVGKWSTLLAERGAYVIGLDISLTLLQKYKQRVLKRSVRCHASPVQADCFHIPFLDETFDGATLNWIIAHITYARNKEFMHEVGRIVKRNGWLVISDSYWRGQQGGKEQVQTRLVAGKQHEVYKYYYAPEELKKLVEMTFGKVKNLFTTTYEQICLAHRTG